MQLQSYYLWLIASISLLSCAQLGRPNGGKKDSTPPQIINTQSSPDKLLNYQGQALYFAFDEFIQLKNFNNQAIISPPLKYTPKTKIKNKTLFLSFDEREILKSNTTYIINFGDAIVDLTEGNPTQQIYVFSTGNNIDSLSIKGSVIDAFNGEPVEDILVLVYDNLNDSVIYKNRPIYFAKTNKNGNYHIQYVKPGKFKIVAIQDLNQDYLYNPSSEKVGFINTPIFVNDTTHNIYDLNISQKKKKFRILEENQKGYGLINLNFEGISKNIKVYPYQLLNTLFTLQKDTLKVWYLQDPSIQNSKFIVQTSTTSDTIQISTYKANEKPFKDTIILTNINKNKSINPKSNAQVSFNQPITSFDQNKFILKKDTTTTIPIQNITISQSDPRKIQLQVNLDNTTNPTLFLLPGAISSIFQTTNTDTLISYHKVSQAEDFGNLIIQIDSLDHTKPYIISINNTKNETLKKYTNSQTSSFQDTITFVPPGKYTIEIIEDLDENKQWSPANYDTKTQAERVFFQNFEEEVRSNWDLQVHFILKF